MAKLSSINKNERRKKLVKKYAGRYASLKAKADDKSLDETERLMAVSARLIVNRAALKTDPRLGALIDAFRALAATKLAA